MRINISLAIFILCSYTLNAQYYFKDIFSIQQTQTDHMRLKASGFRNIKIESFEEDGSSATGFRCEKRISKDFSKTTLQTKMPEIGYSLLTTQFDKNFYLIHVTDSSEMSVSYIDYEYDKSGNLLLCKSYLKSSDDDFINSHAEAHVYSYNQHNQPEQMLLIKNKIDTTRILFSYDDAGKVSIEKNARTGAKYYYYYDSSRRNDASYLLTDIVHTSEFTSQLLTDYYMEYNEAGEMIQSTCFENGGKMKTTTRYSYQNGLKSTEEIYINGKYTGKITYSYSK